MVILDDYVIKKYGREIYGTDWHYDHSKGRMVFGWQITELCSLWKGYISTVVHGVSQEKKADRLNKKGFSKGRIEIQMEHLTKLVDMGFLFFPV